MKQSDHLVVSVDEAVWLLQGGPTHEVGESV